MKIIFLSRLFFPHIGGVEKHLFEISKLLVSEGNLVTVIAEKHDEKLKDFEQINGIEIVRMPNLPQNWFKKLFIWSWILRNLKLFYHGDVIHVHDVFFWVFPLKIVFPFKKIFITFHGYEGNSLPGKKAFVMHKIAEMLSSGNICVGDFLKKWYHTNPDYVTYGAVHLTKQKIKNNYTGKLRILYLGRLEEETGIRVYLTVAARMQKEKVSFIMDVYGDGMLSGYAKEFVTQNSLPVRFFGFVNSVEEKMKDYDIIFTSRYLGILEAFAQKKYVYAVYNNPIKKDYLFMTPFKNYLSIAKNEDELYRQLFHSTTHKKNEKIERAYQWVSSYTWNNMVFLYHELWNKKNRLREL